MKAKKISEVNSSPYDKIAAMMGKKMGIKSPFKKGDSRTNTVKQEFFEEADEPVFSLPTLDQYQKAAEHVPVHPLETRKGKKVNEDETPREQETLKDAKAKNLLKELGIPFIYKIGPSGRHRVYLKGDVNEIVKKIKELEWKESGKNEENTVKKFTKDVDEITIYADGKDLPRMTLKPIQETTEDVVESIITKKVVSNSIEPYI